MLAFQIRFCQPSSAQFNGLGQSLNKRPVLGNAQAAANVRLWVAAAMSLLGGGMMRSASLLISCNSSPSVS